MDMEPEVEKWGGQQHFLQPDYYMARTEDMRHITVPIRHYVDREGSHVHD